MAVSAAGLPMNPRPDSNGGLRGVVIVGAGFAGLSAARKLASAPAEIVVIDRHNYALFQPLLYQVATAGLSLLSSWGSRFAAVKPVTALCLVALGLALVYPGKNSRFAVVFGLAVAAGAALDLGQDLFGFDFNINRWLALKATVPVNGAASFRMITGTKLAIALAGSSLALSRFEGHQFTATVLGGLAGVIAMFGLLGCLTSIHMLYGLASIGPPALPAVVGLLCVAGAILLRVGTMPVLRKPRPLSHLLITLGGAIIALLLLFGFNVSVSVADMQLGQVRNQLMSETRTLSAEIDREIVGEIERLQALAGSPSLREGDFAEFQRQAEVSLALRQSGNIVLIDRNMQQLVNTFVPFGTPLSQPSVREAIARALATGKPQVTGLFMGSGVKQLLFSVTLPVEVDAESRYALVRSPNPHALERLVAAHELPAGWQAMVSDGAHRIIAWSEQEDALLGKEMSPAQWPRGRLVSVFEFIDSERRPSLQADAWSELTGWQTAVWAPKALLEGPVRALWWTIGFATLLAFTLVVALAVWLGRIIGRSVGQAARAAIALGEGAPLVLSGTPIAEVDTLMAELRQTATKRRAVEHLLRDSEAIFRAMFEVSSVGKIEVEPKTGRFLRANAAMCEFVGYSEAELLTRTVYDITHPDDRNLDSESLPRLVAGETPGFDMEKRYIRKDGSAVWARVTVNTIRDESGKSLRNIGVILDARK